MNMSFISYHHDPERYGSGRFLHTRPFDVLCRQVKILGMFFFFLITHSEQFILETKIIIIITIVIVGFK